MPAPLKKKPVLIVEDDLDLSVTLARALETAGYEVTAVADYRQASFKLKDTRFACILVDMNLGHDHGGDVIKFSQNPKISDNASTPIIVISGMLKKENIAFIAKRVKAVLVKPFGIQALLDQVGKVAA